MYLKKLTMHYWSQKQRMAEIELGTADGSDEIKVYDEVQDSDEG